MVYIGAPNCSNILSYPIHTSHSVDSHMRLIFRLGAVSSGLSGNYSESIGDRKILHLLLIFQKPRFQSGNDFIITMYYCNMKTCFLLALYYFATLTLKFI